MSFIAYRNLLEAGSFEESSISRIVDFIRGQLAFGMISASRSEDERTPEENRQNSFRLGKEINRAGYGFIETVGGYPETDKTGATRQVKERSFFVPGVFKDSSGIDQENKLKNVLLQLGRHYAQETILYRAYQDRTIRLLACETGTLIAEIGSNLSFQQIDQFWSRLRHGKNTKFAIA